MGAMIIRAIDDIKGVGPKSRRQAEPDHAMTFILSETCEAYCLELQVDYEAICEKAAALYQRIVGKESQEYSGKKRSGRPPVRFKRVHIRQSPGKLNSATYG
jgi:hypothetical protein